MHTNAIASARQPPQGQLNSPASTQMVPETLFPELPALGQAGPSNFYNPALRRSSSTAPEVAVDSSPVHCPTTRVNIQDLEMQHLRRSRSRTAEELENSTGLVNRLQIRRQVHEADAILTAAMLTQAEQDQATAYAVGMEALEEERRLKQCLGSAFVVFLLLILAYAAWCWYHAPEMEYIRIRREAVLRE